jgi:4-amino-4-deoxy-L-arabinose transferase-like glycosyltransferase
MLIYLPVALLNMAVFFGMSLVLFLFLMRILRLSDDSAPEYAVAGIGLGPLLVSWILKWLLTLMPGHSSTFYIVTIVALFAGMLWFGRTKFYLVGNLWRQFRNGIRRFSLRDRWYVAIPLLLAAEITVALFITCLMLPLTGNDPLEYAVTARLIYSHKAAAIYPFVTADPSTGFYAPLTHPLGYVMMMVWCHLLQGTVSHTMLLRTIAPFYMLCTLLLLWVTLERQRRGLGALGVLLYSTVPLIGFVTGDCHIDPLRIHFFFAAFVVLARLIESPSGQRAIFAGLLTGAAMFTHSIGVLVPVFIVPVYVLLSRARWRPRLAHLATICGIALVIAGHRYWVNQQLYGTPISNLIPVWEMPEIGYKDYLTHTRYMETFVDRYVFGLFKGFSKIDMFGFSYWFAAVGLLIGVWAHFRSSSLRVMGLVVICFYGVIVLMLLRGMPSAIMNDRYQLTVQPMIAFLGAFSFEWLLPKDADA